MIYSYLNYCQSVQILSLPLYAVWLPPDRHRFYYVYRCPVSALVFIDISKRACSATCYNAE